MAQASKRFASGDKGLKRSRFILAGFIAACISLSCPILTAADSTLSPSSLLSHATDYNEQHVVVTGTVTRIQEKTSHRGNDYDIFDLCDSKSVRVFAWGHPSITEGQHLAVHGTFSVVKHVGPYTFHNEIEADDNSL